MITIGATIGTTSNSSDSPVSDWILTTGTWNDNNFWIDTENWID